MTRSRNLSATKPTKSTKLREMDRNLFTQQELSQIEELRSRVQDLAEDEYGSIYLQEMSTLWKYVLAKSREDDPMGQSEEMFRTSISWRKEIDIRNLMNEWRGGGEEGSNKQPRTARARFGELCFHGKLLPERSIHGGPILVERLGRLDLPGFSGDECMFMSSCLHVFFSCCSFLYFSSCSYFPI